MKLYSKTFWLDSLSKNMVNDLENGNEFIV